MKLLLKLLTTLENPCEDLLFSAFVNESKMSHEMLLQHQMIRHANKSFISIKKM